MKGAQPQVVHKFMHPGKQAGGSSVPATQLVWKNETTSIKAVTMERHNGGHTSWSGVTHGFAVHKQGKMGCGWLDWSENGIAECLWNTI